MPNWTYNPALLGSTNADADRMAVRLMIGDTVEAAAKLYDDEVDYLLSSQGSVRAAAIEACRNLAARYSADVDRQVGDLRISASQKATAYRELEKRLRTGLVMTVLPSAGGISISAKATEEADTDRPARDFPRGFTDNPPMQASSS